MTKDREHTHEKKYLVGNLIEDQVISITHRKGGKDIKSYDLFVGHVKIVAVEIFLFKDFTASTKKRKSKTKKPNKRKRQLKRVMKKRKLEGV